MSPTAGREVSEDGKQRGPHTSLGASPRKGTISGQVNKTWQAGEEEGQSWERWAPAGPGGKGPGAFWPRGRRQGARRGGP